MGDTFSSLLIPIGFLLVNIVALLLWWIVRQERARVNELENKVDMIYQLAQEQQRQLSGIYQREQQNIQQQRPMYQGTQVVAEEMSDIQEQEEEDDDSSSESNSVHDVVQPREMLNIEQMEEVHAMSQHNHENHENQQGGDEGDDEQDEMFDDEEDENDNDDCGTELDSLSDNEDVQIYNQNQEYAHDRISVSDIEDMDNHHDEEDIGNVETLQENAQQQAQQSQQTTTDDVKTILIESEEIHDEPQEPQDHDDISMKVDQDSFKKYNKMGVKELRAIAQEKNLPNFDKLKKKALVMMLSEME